MPSPTSPQSRVRRRYLPDFSLGTVNPEATVSSVATDAPTNTVKISFNQPVQYIGDTPPQTWSFGGLRPAAYTQRSATSCRLLLTGPILAGSEAIILPGDPAIRTTAGGSVAGYNEAITTAAAEVIATYLSSNRTLRWEFSTTLFSKTTLTGLQCQGAAPIENEFRGNVLWTKYAGPVAIGATWNIVPATTTLHFANNTTLSAQAGNVRAETRTNLVTVVYALSENDLNLVYSQPIARNIEDCDGIQILNQDGIWANVEYGNNLGDYTLQMSSDDDITVHYQWRLIAPFAGLYNDNQIVLPQGGPIQH